MRMDVVKLRVKLRWVRILALLATSAVTRPAFASEASHSDDPQGKKPGYVRERTDNSPQTEYSGPGEIIPDDLVKRLQEELAVVGLLPNPKTGEKKETAEAQRSKNQNRPGLAEAAPAKAE